LKSGFDGNDKESLSPKNANAIAFTVSTKTAPRVCNISDIDSSVARTLSEADVALKKVGA